MDYKQQVNSALRMEGPVQRWGLSNVSFKYQKVTHNGVSVWVHYGPLLPQC